MKVGKWLAAAVLAASVGVGAAANAAELGAYLGGGCTGANRLGAFTTWLGHKPQRGLDFLDNRSWDAMEAAATWSAKCWKPTGLQMTFSIPMLTSDKTTSLEAGAQGAYDHRFRNIAATLVQSGHANAAIRIGWEFNHGWFPWAAKSNPTAWVAYWRRIVTAMRAVPGSNFTFDWCVGAGPGQIDPATVYPGDSYVDTIGMDEYNTTWATVPETTTQRWNYRLRKSVGLLWHRDFAALHGKKMTYPRVGNRDAPGWAWAR